MTSRPVFPPLSPCNALTVFIVCILCRSDFMATQSNLLSLPFYDECALRAAFAGDPIEGRQPLSLARARYQTARLKYLQKPADSKFIIIIMIIKYDHKQTENCLTVNERLYATGRNKPTDLRLLCYCVCARACGRRVRLGGRRASPRRIAAFLTGFRVSKLNWGNPATGVSRSRRRGA